MNDRFKFRIWWKKENRYRVDVNIIPIGHLENFSSDGFVIEQCIGLKDKNGRLIYESDYVKDKFGNTFLIKWFNAKFICEDQAEMQPIFSPSQELLFNWGVEIIGNIHKTKGGNND